MQYKSDDDALLRREIAHVLSESSRRFDGVIAAVDALIADTRAATGEGVEAVVTCEQRLTKAGVFLGEHGLRGLLNADKFWEEQPYGTRLYYGDGITDYLQIGILRTAVEILDGLHPQPAQGGQGQQEPVECHGLDTPERVCFYEQDFYVLSNFSSFSVEWCGCRFPTAEHLYHWLKFIGAEDDDAIMQSILDAPSAHEAFKIAQANKSRQRADWNEVRVAQMKRILHAKASQHEYVHRKLLATGERELVENSWRDDFWGWGPDRAGLNMLGKLWMEVRAELRANGESAQSQTPPKEQGQRREITDAMRVFWNAYEAARGPVNIGKTAAGVSAVLEWYESTRAPQPHNEQDTP